MKLQSIAFKKAKAAGGHNIRIKYSTTANTYQRDVTRLYSTESSPAIQSRDQLAKEHVKKLSSQQKAKKEARAIDRDFFISVLGSSATKRDARAYLKNFTPTEEPLSKERPASEVPPPTSYSNGVNLGGFYPARAVSESPKFVQGPVKHVKTVTEPKLHVALVKIRAPQTLHSNTLQGVAKTLSQLGRLGLASVVVVDCNEGTPSTDDSPNSDSRNLAVEQANRVVAAIDAHSEHGARLVNNVIEVSENLQYEASAAFLGGKTRVALRKLLMTPLKRGIVPVLPSVGFTEKSQKYIAIAADDVVLALTREFAGFQSPLPDEDANDLNGRLRALREEVSVDRLIILDPLGGIPATDRPNGYHVFLNMEQEFDLAKQDLSQLQESEGNAVNSNSNHASHIKNLKLVRSVLSMLPRTSSALLTTPYEAANSSQQPELPFQATGVGTRRQRNPLIHNLLTDKPIFSSSLPAGRIAPSNTSSEYPVQRATPTTFAKHGMSVTIFPDPKIAPWKPPQPGEPRLNLTDSHIDLPRLVHLIEDSFGRKLDVSDYLKRVNGLIAGVIIAGEYEGGALLTWELPPGVVDNGSPESRARMVPYLDKFAVLKRSQGSGGTADIVFKAMVRDCFSEGVCWRSRKTNVVNKWYFERSRGTWKLPDTEWTMFWTTRNLSLDQQKFKDYEDVCRGIVPSWADNKNIMD